MRFVKSMCLFLTVAVLFGASATGCDLKMFGNKKEEKKVEKVNIKYWSPWGGSGIRYNAEKKVVDNFNKKQDKIFADMQSMPYSRGITTYDNKLLPAIAGGTTPDVIFVDGVISDAVQHDFLLDITNMVERDKFSYDIFYKYKADQCLYKGGYYAMPYNADYVGTLLYNKTLFKKCGLDPNKPPKTLEDVEKYTEKMTVKGTDGFFTSVGFVPWDGLYRRNESVVAPFGGSFADKDGNPSPKNSIVIESLKWLMKFVDKYGYQKVNDSLAKLGCNVDDGFVKGNIGMRYSYNVIVQDLLDKEVTFEWDIDKFPTKDPNNTNPGWGRGFVAAIPKLSKHPNEAFEFLKYVTGDEAQTILMDNIPRGKWLSSSRKANEHIRGQIPSQLQFFIDEVFPVIGGEQVVSKNWATYNKMCNTTIEDIIQGKQELTAALDNLDQKSKALFNENK